MMVSQCVTGVLEILLPGGPSVVYARTSPGDCPRATPTAITAATTNDNGRAVGFEFQTYFAGLSSSSSLPSVAFAWVGREQRHGRAPWGHREGPLRLLNSWGSAPYYRVTRHWLSRHFSRTKLDDRSATDLLREIEVTGKDDKLRRVEEREQVAAGRMA